MKHSLSWLLDEIRMVDSKKPEECSRKQALTWIFVQAQQVVTELRQLKKESMPLSESCRRVLCNFIDEVLGDA
jgi:hypothetical protein